MASISNFMETFMDIISIGGGPMVLLVFCFSLMILIMLLRLVDYLREEGPLNYIYVPLAVADEELYTP